MTIREAMNTPLREILTVCAMLLLLCQGYLLLALCGIRKNGKSSAAAFLTLLAESVLFFLLLDGIFHYGESDYPRTWPAATEAFCVLPVWLLILAEILFAGVIAWEIHRLIRFREEYPTPWSVKETIDLLPAGAAFAEEDGNVVLANITINEIFRALTGKVLSNLNPLCELAEKQEQNNIHVVKAVYPESSRVWQLASGRITEKQKTYIWMTATDITEQAEINEALQDKNEKLKEINRRLDIYNRNAERIIISQELLNARMQVHSETGHILLVSRHYLDHPGSVDEAAFLETLKITNEHLLREYEEDDTERDPLAEAVEMAGAIGVTVKMSGLIPEEDTARNILAAAVSECATNTRKHSDGDYLYVEVDEEKDELTFKLSSRGKAAELQEVGSGGLGSLRALVENAGGTMAVSLSTAFILTIYLPKTGKMAPAGDAE